MGNLYVAKKDFLTGTTKHKKGTKGFVITHLNNIYVEINGNEHIFGVNSFLDTFEPLDEKRDNLIDEILN